MSAGCASAGLTLRWVRACVLAAVALLTGGSAHALAGEALPPTWTLLAALGIVAIVVEPLLRHPASTRRVVMLLAGGEMFVHLALTAMARVESHGAGAMTGMHHGEMAGRGMLTALPDLVAGLSAHDLLMAEAHGAAMAVVGLWLAAGEHALWTLLSLALRPIATAVDVLLNAPTWVLTSYLALDDRRQAFDEAGRRPAREASAARSVTRRGPPTVAPRLLGV
jgi:hypothetical protein